MGNEKGTKRGPCKKCSGRFHTYVEGEWRPCECYFRARAQELMARAGVAPEFRAVKLADFDTAGKTGNVNAVKLVRALAEGFKGREFPDRSVIIFGEAGTGKTMLAIIIVRYALAAGLPAVIVDAERVLAIRFDQDQEFGRVEDLMAPDVLCLELGGEYQTKMTPWLITYIIGQRRHQEKFTFLVSSVAPNELKARYGDEAHAALLGERFAKLTLQER